MNQPLSAIAVFIGILLAIMAWRRIYLYAVLRRLRFGYPGSERISPEQIPPETRMVLDEAAMPLSGLGFEAVGYRAGVPTVRRSDGGLLYSTCYLHRESGTFATIFPAENPEPGAIASLSFETWFAEGHVAVTVNRRSHTLLPMPANFRLDDGYFGSVAEQWELHRQRLAGMTGERVADYNEMTKRNDVLAHEMLRTWQADGVMQTAGAELLQLTPRGTLQHMARLLRGSKRVARLPPMAVTASKEACVNADLIAYQAHEAMSSQGVTGRSGKLLLFVTSAVLGVIAFGLAFSWEIVPVLLGVLLFHEFGHVLAMRVTGYRNVHVMVIPLLGAVASGRKDDVSPWAKLAVLLAGPLPGLVIAVVILHAISNDISSHPVLFQMGLMALAINLFNLLPFAPLDGGQIVETFLFARWPRLRFGFYLASCMALVAIGIWLDSYVLVAFAVLLLMAARRFRLNYGLARRIGTMDKDRAPREILTALHDSGDSMAKNLGQRIQTVRGVLPLIAARPARMKESALALTLYMAVIALPVFSLTDVPPARQLFFTLFKLQQVAAETKPDWDAELARAATDDERWRILNEAALWEEMENYEIEEAHRRYRQALVIAKDFPAGDLRLLDTKLGLIRTTADERAALTSYRELLDEVSALGGDERIRLAQVNEAIFSLNDDAPVEQRIGYLREAIAVRKSIEHESYEIANDHVEIARILYRQGETDKAGAELHLGFEANKGAYRAIPLVWLLIDQGKGVDAEETARNYLMQEQFSSIELDDTLAWALLAQGRGREGYEHLNTLISSPEIGDSWQRFFILLDLMHFSREDQEVYKRWSDQFKSEITREKIQASMIAFELHSDDEYSPWEKLRTHARLEMLDRTGLSNGEPAQSCR